MKPRAAALLVLMVSLSFVPVLQAGAVHAQAAGSYTERLDVYTAGSNAMWFATFGGVNASSSAFSAAEGVQGVTGYTLTAVKVAGVSPDWQIFGPDGYGVLDVPFALQGVYLVVNASSPSGASAVASAFDPLLGAAFVQASSSAGTYTFFSPVDFATVAAPALFALYPSSMKGMASMFSETSLLGAPSPVIAVSAVRSGPSFVHSLRLGAFSSSVLDPTGSLLMNTVLRASNATVETSSLSSSSVIAVHSLDGLIASSDHAAKSNHMANFSGSYLLSVTPGKKARVNVTIAQSAPSVEVYRTLDRGNPAAGDFLSVTVLVRDTSATAVQNVAADDAWWTSYPGLFQLTSSNSSISVASIGPGQNVSRTYVLKVLSTSNASGTDIVLPPLKVSYAFQEQGITVAGSVLSNQAEVRVGQHGPALSIVAHSSLATGSPMGSDGHFTVAVSNTGDAPALNLRLANYTSQSLAPGGNTWSVAVPLAYSSLLDGNISSAFSVSWTTPSGQTESISSNEASVVLSHTAMEIPFVVSAANATVGAASSPSLSLNATYSLENLSGVNASQVNGSVALPAGMACEKVVSGPGSCSGSSMVERIGSLQPTKPETSVVLLSLAADNYVVRPANGTLSYKGITLHVWGSPLALPAGLAVSKSFSPDHVFQGMTSTVTVVLTNLGSRPVYNLSMSASADSFDNLVSSSGAQKAVPLVPPRQSVNFTYQVSVSSAETGNRTTSAVQSGFVFGGLHQTLSSGTSSVVVFRPVYATAVLPRSSPVEGQPFTVKFVLANPSSVAVSGVVLTVPLPAGLQLLNSSGVQVQGKDLVASIGTLAARANQTVSATLRASLGLSFDMSGSSLSFQYGGAKLQGLPVQKSVSVGEDVSTRYYIPILVAVLVLLMALVFIKRRSTQAPPPARSS